MENKKNTILIILLTVFITTTVIFGGYILYDKVIKTNNSNESEAKEEEPKILTKEELLMKIEGEYLRKSENLDFVGLGVYITNGTYLSYQTHSEYGPAGTIQNVESIDANKYILTVHYDEEDNVLSYTPEQTITVNIDISKIADEILIVGDKEYKKYHGEFLDWEAKSNFVQNEL